MEQKSKTIISVLIIIIFVLVLILIGKWHTSTTKPAVEKTVVADTATPITVTKKTLTEDNFTGKTVSIEGSSKLADLSREYVAKILSDFREQANTDVPALRAQFGTDNPPSSYEINIDATYAKGTYTESMIISVYVYTGGAHGSNTYNVITTSRKTGEVLTLSDIIKAGSHEAFTSFVKKQLLSWRPNGSTEPVVFADTVGELTFDSFTNWSLSDKNLTLYFSQYEIGPSVLGEVAFPVPVSKIKDFLVTL